jgi:hypothetical protein
MVPPVVNYKRMRRLEIPGEPSVAMNINAWIIAFLLLCALGLYKRHIDISQRRARWHT